MMMTFFTKGVQASNTDRKSVGTTRKIILKNEPHFSTFHESILVSLWTFQPTLVDKQLN